MKKTVLLGGGKVPFYKLVRLGAHGEELHGCDNYVAVDAFARSPYRLVDPGALTGGG